MKFDKLLLLREEKELKQKELAEVLGVKQVNISNWENMKEIIPLNRLNNYANYFNVSLDYLTSLNSNKEYKPKCDINRECAKKRLKEFRKNNNLTQENLANILNTTHSTISGYETGKTLILTSFAYQICKKYNISMDWLCGRT